MGNLFLPAGRGRPRRRGVDPHLVPHAARAGDAGHPHDLSRHRAGTRPRLDPGRQEPRDAHRRPLAGVDRRSGRTSSRTACSCPPASRPSPSRAPTPRPTMIGPYEQDGERHLFLCDGYAASAEAIQAASLAPMLGLVAVCLPLHLDLRGARITASGWSWGSIRTRTDFPAHLAEVLGREVDTTPCARFRAMIDDARQAGIPLQQAIGRGRRLLPREEVGRAGRVGLHVPRPLLRGRRESRRWSRGLLPGDGAAGRLARRQADHLHPAVMETLAQSWLVFNPLLSRFMGGEDYEHRPVRSPTRAGSATSCRPSAPRRWSSSAGPHPGPLRPHPARGDPAARHQVKLREILRWYKKHHPIWFAWLDIAAPKGS